MSLFTRKKDEVPASVQAGLRVLDSEIAGLQALKNTIATDLSNDFLKAIERIEAMRTAPLPGRLIVAGIGKSGHVARKIAATMASTGTPAYYVHPGEASHGDLGMIAENDVILLLSNSGENAELSDMIHYARRFGIALIAMTSNAQSTLARHSDITLLLPPAPEACPNGLAPTTSTTMMLAMGDALAVALLEKKGLTAEQFRQFHPGGKLGKSLLKVSDLMRKGDDLAFVDFDDTMDKVIVLMTQKNMGCAIVMDDDVGEIAGIITDGDLKRHMAPDLLRRAAIDIMTKNPKTIELDALAVEAVNIMTRTPGQYLTSLIVPDIKNRTVGLIRLQDCLQAGLV
jgi:arabinose-5-phosphate isomerase